MKWFRALKDLVRDVVNFVRVRKQQRKLYGSIIDDLEVINALSNALNDQIRVFARKWNLFPDAQNLVDTYNKYVEESQKIYFSARKGILNELFAEKNKKLINETIVAPPTVHRKEGADIDGWQELYDRLNVRKPMIVKILKSCEKRFKENNLMIAVDDKNKFFIGMLMKNKPLIDYCCKEVFGENVVVEIMEKGE